MKSKRIYCAGPLFNNIERDEMLEISMLLEAKGYTTFLPQRDGYEVSKGAYLDDVFNFDVAQLKNVMG